MQWKLQAENKFDKGINYMTNESELFIRLLEEFNKKNNLLTFEPLSHGYLLPEGATWLVKLKNGEDVLIEKCSYRVINEEIDYMWVDFDVKQNQVIVEINYKNQKAEKQVLLYSNDIIEHYP